MDCLAIIEKYYRKGTPLYEVMVSHGQSVKEKALNIATDCKLAVDLKFVGEAAMLHDIGIFLTNAPNIHCRGNHKYIEHGYLGADILRHEGYPLHALVCERHTGAGLLAKEIRDRNLPLPERDMMPISLEEQLICYADMFYSKTKLNIETSVRDIRRKASLWGERSALQFEDWHYMFSTKR